MSMLANKFDSLIPVPDYCSVKHAINPNGKVIVF
jgi:hypothetical protein